MAFQSRSYWPRCSEYRQPRWQTRHNGPVRRQRSSRSPHHHAGRRLAGAESRLLVGYAIQCRHVPVEGRRGLTASVGNFQMHNRGHGSRSPIKPGLHLTFDAT